MDPQRIGGIYTEVFTPAGGVSPRNATRVLINVHGGGFVENARTESHIESVPIASIGQIRVISIDYRQAPEFAFPSASEDVAAVYRDCLRHINQRISVFMVLRGGFVVGSDLQGMGGESFESPTYTCRPPGAAHGPFSSKRGCLLYEIHYYDESGR